MPIFILTVVAQLVCAYHCVSTGRDKSWLWLIILAPGIGCLIYLVTQLLPDAGNSRTARSAKDAAIKSLDPNREYREAQRAFDMVESVENRLKLADALIALGKFSEAEPHLTQCLMGAHRSDPHILMRLAEVLLRQGNPQSCIDRLDQLQRDNPGYQSQTGHLLYSMALESLGDIEEALQSYASLADYATGEEARVRYGLLLKAAGRQDEARAILEEAIKRVERGTKFYRKAQKEWKVAAQQALTN